MENAKTKATGAFSWEIYTDSGAEGSKYDGVSFSFAAKSSNSIYSASTTVQPNALSVNFIIKY